MLGLVFSIIAIYEGAHKTYEAASNVKGLASKVSTRRRADPLALHVLGLIEQIIKANTVS